MKTDCRAKHMLFQVSQKPSGSNKKKTAWKGKKATVNLTGTEKMSAEKPKRASNKWENKAHVQCAFGVTELFTT